MSFMQKLPLFLLRVSLGWLFFYAGITKVLNPSWTAEGYMRGAKTFPEFYQWMINSGMIPLVDFMNEWGLTLLGVSLILGIGLRLSSVLGAFLMLLYYFPALDFPYPNPHSYIVDEHIVYALALLLLAGLRAGRVWGLEAWCSRLPLCSRIPVLRSFLG